MRLDEEVALSRAGRQAIERELAGLLRDRRDARFQRSSGLRIAHAADQMLAHSVDRLSHLCNDLGFVSEDEAEHMLLDQAVTNTVSHETANFEATAPDEEPKVREVRR